MANLSQSLQTEIFNWITGAATSTAPTSLNIVYSSTDPASGGINAAGDYVPITLSLDLVNKKITNTSAVTMTNLSGTADYFAITDQANNLLLSGSLYTHRVFAAGDSDTIAVNALEIVFGEAFHPSLIQVIYDWLTGTAFPASPTTLNAELSRGSVFNPPANTDGYAAQPTTFDPPTYQAGVGTTIQNSQNILFPDSTTNAWGVITHIFLTDQTNNPLLSAKLSTPKQVATGESIGVGKSVLKFTLS